MNQDGPMILYADDDPDIRELVSFGLASFGYRVVLAADGSEALRLAQTWRPDLLILDVMMPGIDGYELTRRLRADKATSDIPIALLTARVEDADVKRGLELGADAYIKKPFTFGELSGQIRALLQPA